MRKYHQAALAIIATLSLVALLFYRHEYNRLRYVLEVFNYFGRPSEMELCRKNCSENIDRCNYSTILEHATSNFPHEEEDPITSWQRLNDDAYVYSAYAIGDGEIRALGYARSKKIGLLTCKVINENEIEPIAGEFSYKIIDSTENANNASRGIYRAYHLICRYRIDNKKQPVVAGVIFASKAARNNLAAETMLSVRKLHNFRGNENNDDEIAICVAPSDSRPIVNRDTIDFISFHHSLGMERFVVYDNGISQRINSIFKHIAKQSGADFDFHYSTIPWNFPFATVSADVAKRVVEADCLYRFSNRVRFVATLTWDEYVVIKYHRTVGKLFRDIDKTGFVGRTYEISTINFCLDDNNDERPIVYEEMVNDDPRRVLIHRSLSNVSTFEDGKSREITSDIIVVKRYERHCNRSGGRQLARVADAYTDKFSTIVTESPIYKLFRLYV